jgi:hypothetical protein
MVCLGVRTEDLLVDLVAEVRFALEGNHVRKAGALRDDNRRIRLTGEFVADVFHEQQNQDVILVLAGIHAAAQFVATGPERGVKFGFFESHWSGKVGVPPECLADPRHRKAL